MSRTGESLLVESSHAAAQFASQPSGLPIDPHLAGQRQPLVLAYWPLARTNNFQALLYNQGWKHGVASFPVGQLEDLAEIPWAGPAACHFHWLATINTEESVGQFEALLKRLKDQRRSIVWTVHNVLPHDEADIELALRVRRVITEAADLIHIMNDRTPDLVEPFFSLAGKRLFRSPHPSYLGDLPSTVTREMARFEFGLRPETTVFLCFGAIQAYKGIEDLIAASQELARNRPDLDWVVVIAGACKDPDLARRLREAEALDPRLLVYPRRVAIEDVQYFFRAADYAVCPYRTSLNSGAAMLALSFGLPLVAPQSEAFAEYLERGAGIGFARDEPGALATALADAATTDPTAMRNRARSLAEERCPEVASDTFFEGLLAGLKSGGEREVA